MTRHFLFPLLFPCFLEFFYQCEEGMLLSLLRCFYTMHMYVFVCLDGSRSFFGWIISNFQCLVSDEKLILRGFSDAIAIETFVHILETPFEDARNKLLPIQTEIPNNANFLPSVDF